MEVDHHENGIISKIRKYQAGTVDEYDTVEMFDELGVPQKMFYNNNSWFRLWRINDFQVEPEVPCFKYGYASPDHPAIDERLRKVLISVDKRNKHAIHFGCWESPGII